MVAGELAVDSGRVLLGVAIEDVGGDLEALEIDAVEAFLHRGVVGAALGIGEVAGVSGEAAGHLRWGDGADVARGVDEVGADEELPGLAVDHAVGRGAPDAPGEDPLLEVAGDLVQFVRRTVRHVGRVGDDPEPLGPGDHGAGSALVLAVEDGEVRVDAADLDLRRRGVGDEEEEEGGEGAEDHAVTVRTEPLGTTVFWLRGPIGTTAKPISPQRTCSSSLRSRSPRPSWAPTPRTGRGWRRGPPRST